MAQTERARRQAVILRFLQRRIERMTSEQIITHAQTIGSIVSTCRDTHASYRRIEFAHTLLKYLYDAADTSNICQKGTTR